MTDGRFTGADRQAADALVSVIEALVTLGMRYEELEHRVRCCDDFVVGHAYTAFLAELAGDANRAACLAGRARRSRRAITRRERQLVEVLLLVIDGDRERAAGLAAEHIDEFDEDRDALGLVATGTPATADESRPSIAATSGAEAVRSISPRHGSCANQER